MYYMPILLSESSTVRRTYDRDTQDVPVRIDAQLQWYVRAQQRSMYALGHLTERSIVS